MYRGAKENYGESGPGTGGSVGVVRIRKGEGEQDDCLQHLEGSMQPREGSVWGSLVEVKGVDLDKETANSPPGGLQSRPAGRALRVPHPIPEGHAAGPRLCLSEAV